jgi:serine/threonine protein phosphatase 1
VAHIAGPPPPGFQRFSLLGNHEAMLLDFLRDPVAHAYYLDEGGLQTMLSYGIEIEPRRLLEFDPGRRLRDAAGRFPGEIAAFIAQRPLYLSLPGWLFVHAGIRPGVPLAGQTDEDLLWIRAPFLTSQLTGGLRVVHGHTPGPGIVVTPHRIGIDTMCFRTGVLSAVRITPNGRTKFFATDGG